MLFVVCLFVLCGWNVLICRGFVGCLVRFDVGGLCVELTCWVGLLLLVGFFDCVD